MDQKEKNRRIGLLATMLTIVGFLILITVLIEYFQYDQWSASALGIGLINIMAGIFIKNRFA